MDTGIIKYIDLSRNLVVISTSRGMFVAGLSQFSTIPEIDEVVPLTFND